MEKIKKILIGIVVAAIVFVWWESGARRDYTWSKTIIEEKQKDGWVVGTTQADVIDITHPWTIFKRPVVRIAFVKPSETIYLDSGLVLAQTLWVDYTNMSKTEELACKEIFDYKNNKEAFVDDSISIGDLDPSKLKWEDNVTASGVNIAKIVCRPTVP